MQSRHEYMRFNWRYPEAFAAKREARLGVRTVLKKSRWRWEARKRLDDSYDDKATAVSGVKGASR